MPPPSSVSAMLRGCLTVGAITAELAETVPSFQLTTPPGAL